MHRNRLSPLGLSLFLAALLALLTAPLLAAPPSATPPTAAAWWQTLVAWLETLWEAPGDEELGVAPLFEPNGRTVEELGVAPWPDPTGNTGSHSGSGEPNQAPWFDPAG